MIWGSGPSGSIPLSQASHGNVLNIVEKLTDHILPFSDSIFTVFNLVPTLVIVLVMPFVFMLIRPRGDEMQGLRAAAGRAGPAARPVVRAAFARKLEQSPSAACSWWRAVSAIWA